MNTAVLVGHKGKTLPASLLGTACQKYPGCYGMGVVLDDDIIMTKEVFDPEMSVQDRATKIYNLLADYKDATKVLWFSKEVVTGASMQPFPIMEEPDDNDKEVICTRIAAVLYGDYTPSKIEGTTETGEYHANEDTLKPSILEMLGECQGDPDNLRKRLEDEEKTFCGNLCDNDDCGAVLIFFDDEAVQIAKSDNSGKVVDGYFTTDPSLVVDPASSRGIEANAGGKKRRALGKGSTIREPVSIKGAEEIAAQSGGKIQVQPQITIVKSGPPPWCRGTNESIKKWYRVCNQVKDDKGFGVVPPGAEWRRFVEVSVDARLLKATSHNELALIVKSFSIPAAVEATSTVIPLNAGKPVSPPNTHFVKITSALEKESLHNGWVKDKLVNSKPASAEQIQAEEKELPTFKMISGYGLNDLKGKLFEDLFDLVTKHPKTATQALWDALHRNPTTGAMSSAPTQTSVPVVQQQQKKRRIGASR